MLSCTLYFYAIKIKIINANMADFDIDLKESYLTSSTFYNISIYPYVMT